MSVTFSIGVRVTDDEPSLNLANRNAADLLAWLGLPTDDLFGQMPARELAARCRRRLWPEPRNFDEALPAQDEGWCVTFGRTAGYLRGRT